jgi:SAM-dependent methyltransferase
MKLAEPAHVAEQYRDSARFDARIRIYELYDASPERWPHWLFPRFGLAKGERVLELGCGTGNVWRENAERVPEGVELTLTDLSPGMLDQARARLAGLPLAFALRQADAQAIPFPDARFDVVIANHMLYHVPDRARALCEVARVLRPGGRFLAGTNAWTHLMELRELLTRFGVETALLPGLRDPDGFDLERAAEEISEVLAVTGVERRTSALEIRDVEPLVDYVHSMREGARSDDVTMDRLRAHVARQIVRMGSFHIGTAVGVVRALKR